LALLLAFLVPLSTAPVTLQAATLYWDGGTINIVANGNGVSGGALGDWNTGLTNWDSGPGAHVAWVNANNDTAFFGGTAGTVTLQAPITVGGLFFFSNSGYAIAAGAQGLTFGATDTTISLVNQTTSSTSSATISGTVAGNNVIFTSLNRSVASTLAFTGATAGGYTGTTTINPNMTVTLDGATSLNRNLLNTTGITLNCGVINSGVIANNANGNADRINNAANWTVNSGSFTWVSSNAGGTYAETLGTVALTTGQMNFTLGGNLSSGSQTLTLTDLTQAGTSAVTFSNAATSFDSTVGAATDVIRVTGAASTTARQHDSTTARQHDSRAD